MRKLLIHTLEKLVTPYSKSSVELERNKERILKELQTYAEGLIFSSQIEFNTLQREINNAKEELSKLRSERYDLRSSIQKLTNDLENIKANKEELLNKLLRIAIERLEGDKLRVENSIDRYLIHAEKDISFKVELELSKRAKALTAPLVEENKALKYLLVNKGLVTNGDSTNKVTPITTDFLNTFLVNLKDNVLRPQHLRISGASESGKSFLVNNLTSYYRSKFNDLKISLCDPYESESNWFESPTAYTPESTLKTLENACKIIDDGSIKGHWLLVIDEIDTLVQDNPETVEFFKKIWKRGRHKGIYLWALGQNANVKHLKLQLNDLKNVHSIHIGDCGIDYLNSNNYLKRDKKDLMTLLEATQQDTKYCCVVIPKGKNGVIKIMPESLDLDRKIIPFKPSESRNDRPDCIHCESNSVVKNGRSKGKQLYKCNNCGKQFLETVLESIVNQSYESL